MNVSPVSRKPTHLRRFAMDHRNITIAVFSSAVIFLGLSPYPSLGQEKTDSITENGHRSILSVSLSLGTASSGPAADIEEAMISSGFNKTTPAGFFGGPIANPFSRTGFGTIGLPWMIALHYSLRPPFLLGAIVSDAPIGETNGYHDPYLSLSIKYSVFTIASTFSLQFADCFHLGVGPAIYIAESDAEIQSAAKFGVLFDLGLSIPAHSCFFFVVSFQYRYVGNVDVGPKEARIGNAAATMPASSVSFDHSLLAVGIGTRL